MTHSIGESTVQLFKKKYLEKIRKRLDVDGNQAEVRSLPVRQRGCKVMLGEQLDGSVQALCSAGTPIGPNIVMAAGEAMIRTQDRTIPYETGLELETSPRTSSSTWIKQE